MFSNIVMYILGCFSTTVLLISEIVFILVLSRYPLSHWGHYLGVRPVPRRSVNSVSFGLILFEQGVSLIQNPPH